MRSLITLIVLSMLTLAGPAAAFPVSVVSSDLPSCDSLLVPNNLHELGTPGFPANETIFADDLGATVIACPSTVGPIPTTMVRMTNLTGIDWTDVWYVADPDTTLTNVDGLVNGEHAFRIDSLGINKPLFAESGSIANVFEAGESWEFLIDGYFNSLGISASSFGSVGLVGGLSIGDSVSSGSIIAVPVPAPEPAAFVLMAMAGAALTLRRARQTS